MYVGNLGWGVTDDQLQELFSAHGTVQLAQVMMDRDTGRSKGFGFVEMTTDQEAQAAITGLNAQVVEGRPLTVNEATRARTAAGAAAGGAGTAGAAAGRRRRGGGRRA